MAAKSKTGKPAKKRTAGKAAKKVGRPSKYTLAIADKICAGLAEGKSLVRVCKGANMPTPRTVYSWLRSNENFLQMYVRAKDDAADKMVDDIIEIADVKTEDANSRRVRIDARKWVAAKLKPKKYGDRITHAGDDESPLMVLQKAWADALQADGGEG